MTIIQSEQSLIDRYLPQYDVVLTEHLVVGASSDSVFKAAADLDFMTVRSPLLIASFFIRGLPARLSGKTTPAPPKLCLTDQTSSLPGWVYLGDRPGTEIAFGAVGKVWQPNIEWRDVPEGEFASFSEAGWGKIACHFLLRADGPDRTVLTYECRTVTTDSDSRAQMTRYWWLIRPFVAHIMRATLRTIRQNAEPPPPGSSSNAATGTNSSRQ